MSAHAAVIMQTCCAVALLMFNFNCCQFAKLLMIQSALLVLIPECKLVASCCSADVRDTAATRTLLLATYTSVKTERTLSAGQNAADARQLQYVNKGALDLCRHCLLAYSLYGQFRCLATRFHCRSSAWLVSPPSEWSQTSVTVADRKLSILLLHIWIHLTNTPLPIIIKILWVIFLPIYSFVDIPRCIESNLAALIWLWLPL